MATKKQRVNLTLPPEIIEKVRSHYPHAPLATAISIIVGLHFPEPEETEDPD